MTLGHHVAKHVCSAARDRRRLRPGRRDDFDDPHELARLAATVGVSREQFEREFGYLIESEPEPLVLDASVQVEEQAAS